VVTGVAQQKRKMEKAKIVIAPLSMDEMELLANQNNASYIQMQEIFPFEISEKV